MRKTDKWIQRWEVPSASRPDADYTVALGLDGLLGCTCMAWTRQRKTCRHIKVVQETYASQIQQILWGHLVATSEPIEIGRMPDEWIGVEWPTKKVEPKTTNRVLSALDELRQAAVWA